MVKLLAKMVIGYYIGSTSAMALGGYGIIPALAIVLMLPTVFTKEEGVDKKE